MQAYFGERGRERAHFDQASTILNSNSEEAWGETKMRPREWELEWKGSNGGGGGEGKIRLPAVIVFSRNAVRPRTESVIGAV